MKLFTYNYPAGLVCSPYSCCRICFFNFQIRVGILSVHRMPSVRCLTVSSLEKLSVLPLVKSTMADVRKRRSAV